MRQSRSSRVLRGVAAASGATFFALMSHVAGGGAVPGLLGFVVPWILAVMVCTVLAGRALSLIRLTLAVTVSQALFHVLFVLGSAAPGGASPAGHHHGAATLSIAASSPASVVHTDTLMMLFHLLAAAVTVVVLHRAESAVRTLLSLSAQLRAWMRRILLRIASPAPPVPARPMVAADRPAIARSAPHLTVVLRRGPPLTTAL